MQHGRPGDMQFHVETDRERSVGLKVDAPAGKVDRLTRSRLKHASPPDQPPTQIQTDFITPIVAALAGDSGFLNRIYEERVFLVHGFPLSNESSMPVGGMSTEVLRVPSRLHQS